MVLARTRLVALVVSATALVAFPACSGGSEEGPSARTASAVTTRAPLTAPAQGPLRLVASAFADVPLRPEQRTALEQLLTEAESRHKPTRDAGRALTLALADQVERGAVERAALAEKEQALRTAMAKAHEGDVAAVQKAHDLLDASQREAFVEALRSQAKEHAHGRRHGHEGMGALKTELGLTDAQIDQIKTAFREQHKEVHPGEPGRGAPPGFTHPHERGKLLQSFVRDDFDARAALPSPAEHGGPGLDGMARMAERVLPVLTPEQRAKAASWIRERMDMGEGP